MARKNPEVITPKKAAAPKKVAAKKIATPKKVAAKKVPAAKAAKKYPKRAGGYKKRFVDTNPDRSERTRDWSTTR